MSIFKSNVDMPACEQPFAKPMYEIGYPIASGGTKPEVTRTMLTECDRRVAQGYSPLPHSVRNLEPAKRGRHY